MRVVITDLLTGDCELTGWSNIEVVRVQFDETTPEVHITVLILGGARWELNTTVGFGRAIHLVHHQRKSVHCVHPSPRLALPGGIR